MSNKKTIEEELPPSKVCLKCRIELTDKDIGLEMEGKTLRICEVCKEILIINLNKWRNLMDKLPL
jgi:hypothetical protein